MQAISCLPQNSEKGVKGSIEMIEAGWYRLCNIKTEDAYEAGGDFLNIYLNRVYNYSPPESYHLELIPCYTSTVFYLLSKMVSTHLINGIRLVTNVNEKVARIDVNHLGSAGNILYYVIKGEEFNKNIKKCIIPSPNGSNLVSLVEGDEVQSVLEL